MSRKVVRCRWCKQQYRVIFMRNLPVHRIAIGTPEQKDILCEDYQDQADADYHTDHANGE